MNTTRDAVINTESWKGRHTPTQYPSTHHAALPPLQDAKKCAGFQDSDCRMITMGCSQTELSAVKQHKRPGSTNLELLHALQAQVGRIQALAAKARPARTLLLRPGLCGAHS